ncbi:MAG: putative metal-binding motif-containing protein [Myxococcota bacterium]
MRWICCLMLLGSSAVLAQPECRPGDEFCEQPPPCYREPDNPDCNADCNCLSPDYPACDPFCAPGDLSCDPDCGNPCWDEFGRDICSDTPPPCVPMGERPFEFIDDMDGNDNGEIFALGTRSPNRSCGTLTVDETGYYRIFDTELSESCDDQKDETGYLTITNSCNGEGWAVERNAEERFLIFDSDNSPDCDSDDECDPGKICREADRHGRCCVPEEPVFMGTFLLVAGEPNVICINHWCPEWREENEAGRDFGFEVDGCRGTNSIHFRIDASAIACRDETTLNACTFGCAMGDCLPDPCDSVSCPGFCMDGECLDENPCASVSCEHGCVRGRCLQNRHARGPDADGDGFSELADCDDTDPLVNPDRREICGNGIDDNCNGAFDEAGCLGGEDGGTPGRDGGTAGGDGGGGGSGSGDGSGSGCGCRTVGSADASFALFFALLWFGRRRREEI